MRDLSRLTRHPALIAATMSVLAILKNRGVVGIMLIHMFCNTIELKVFFSRIKSHFCFSLLLPCCYPPTPDFQSFELTKSLSYRTLRTKVFVAWPHMQVADSRKKRWPSFNAKKISLEWWHKSHFGGEPLAENHFFAPLATKDSL